MHKQIRLTIEKLNLGGQGIGYINGKVCFVDFVIPGEEILASILLEKKDYNVAKSLEIIRPSPFRIKPECPLFMECGGCQLQHISYERQIDCKKGILVDTLRHIGKIDYNNIEIFHYTPWHYRNRAQLPIQKNGTVKIGYFSKGTHQVVNTNKCLINHEVIDSALCTIRKRIEMSGIAIYDELRHTGNLRHLVLKYGIDTDQLYIIFVTRKRVLPPALYKKLSEELPNLVGIVQNINSRRTNRIMGNENIVLAGRNYYEDRIHNKIFRIGPNSFFQINKPVFEKIITEIKKEISGSMILDLYAGVGVIGICVADLAETVMAVEENIAAINEGIANARINNVKNIKFVSGKVERKLTEIESADMIILDPPRKGIARETLDRLVELNSPRIVYLSCDPATLSRDTRSLINSGYHIKRACFFDMFPQTYHIETLMVLEK